MQSFAIYSGVPKGVNKDEYKETANWLDNLHRSFSETSYRLHEPKPPINTNYWPLWDMAQELQAKVNEFQEIVAANQQAYAESSRVGIKLDDPKQILSLLPPHRVTAGPEYIGYRHWTWNLAFKLKNYPAIAKHAGTFDRNIYNLFWSDNKDQSVVNEFEQIRDCLMPLTDKGFNLSLSPINITTVNLICSLRAYTH